MAIMSYEEIKALGLVKGDRVRYRSGRVEAEATIKRLYVKRSYQGRANGREYYEIAFTDAKKISGFVPSEDYIDSDFNSIEIIKKKRKAPRKMEEKKCPHKRTTQPGVIWEGNNKLVVARCKDCNERVTLSA